MNPPVFKRIAGRTVRLVPSQVCVCGQRKENPKRRYCNRCGKAHGQIMREAHRGKGTGPRKKRVATA